MKIVLALVVGLLLLGCNDEKSNEAEVEITQSIDKIAHVVKEESVNITKNIEKEVTDRSKRVLIETKKIAMQTVENIDKAVDKPNVHKMLIEKKKSTIDGGTLFAKCSGCHGVKADKKALNKSQSIKGWSVTKLTDAINGYKDGSYGGSMKGVMKPQVNKLSTDEIKALAEYISKL